MGIINMLCPNCSNRETGLFCANCGSITVPIPKEGITITETMVSIEIDVVKEATQIAEALFESKTTTETETTEAVQEVAETIKQTNKPLLPVLATLEEQYIKDLAYYNGLETMNLLDYLHGLTRMKCKGCKANGVTGKRSDAKLTKSMLKWHYCIGGCPVGEQMQLIGKSYDWRAAHRRENQDMSNRFMKNPEPIITPEVLKAQDKKNKLKQKELEKKLEKEWKKQNKASSKPVEKSKPLKKKGGRQKGDGFEDMYADVPKSSRVPQRRNKPKNVTTEEKVVKEQKIEAPKEKKRMGRPKGAKNKIKKPEVEKVKKPRGRPRVNPTVDKVKRPVGRPKKNPIIVSLNEKV